MVSVIIPVFNGAGVLHGTLSMLGKSPSVGELIVVDSGSTDESVKIAESFGAMVIGLGNRPFDHGGSRTLGGKKAAGDILVYMTQDAVPADDRSIENLVRPLLDGDGLGAAYGRQLPDPGATLFAAHLRAFNYPPDSCVKSIGDKDALGIKAPAISNSFAAYRRDALDRVGWFKDGIIMAEDAHAGAKLLMAGYGIAYVAEACVYHSHNYTALDEFRRYFDIGVFHRMEGWILDEFGRAEGEGVKFLKSELRYLSSRRAYHLIPASFLRIAFKYLGYKMGSHYLRLPGWLIMKSSMNPGFWDRKHENAA